MTNKTKIAWVFLIIWGALGCYYVGHKYGRIDGAKQMARHLLMPKYNTPSFVDIIVEGEIK